MPKAAIPTTKKIEKVNEILKSWEFVQNVFSFISSVLKMAPASYSKITRPNNKQIRLIAMQK